MAGNVVYGMNCVREALRAGRRVNRLYLAKESRARAWKGLLEEAKTHKTPYDFVPQAKLNELTGTREHQGVAALVSPIEYTALPDCLAACPPRSLLLVLDGVQHPKNVGMLIRTAAGAGASGVLLPERGAALVDDTVLRASAGAAYHVPIVPCKNLGRALRALKDADFWVYGLDASADTDVFSIPWASRCALVLGNENQGLRQNTRKDCDMLAGIPLANGLDSLNVSVAAGIALFQVLKGQR